MSRRRPLALFATFGAVLHTAPAAASPHVGHVARPVDSVVATVVRVDGGSGPVLVSNGVPLPPGQLTTATLGQIHVVVDGTEQAIAVRALSGRHRDGSLRAVLVQFTYPLPTGARVPAVIRFSGVRSAQYVRRDTTTLALPAAALLPTEPTYLIATRLGGDLEPASTPRATLMLARYDADYVAAESTDWAHGPQWNGNGRTAAYDRAYTLYQQWLRTGNPIYWQHATVVVDNYLSGYIAPNQGVAAWYAQTRGVAVAYLTTGHERTRVLLRKTAENLAWAVRPGLVYFMGGQKGDDRSRAKVLEAVMDAAMVGASDPSAASPATMFTPFLTTATLPKMIGDVLGTQRDSGQFGGTDYRGGQKSYMVGMLLAAFIRYYQEFDADPRIPSAVRRASDYMWANEWVPRAQGFKYVTTTISAEDQETPQPSLNTLIAPAFAWLYKTEGRAADRDAVDALLAGQYTARSWWMTNGKSLDQTYSLLFNVAAWRGR